MEIIRLEDGQTPPADVDCIRIYPSDNGLFDLMGTALCGDESVTLISEKPHATLEAAIDHGVAWADQFNLTKLYIAFDPAPTEADKPL